MSSSVTTALIVLQNMEREQRILNERRAELSRLSTQAQQLCIQIKEAQKKLGKSVAIPSATETYFDKDVNTIADADAALHELRTWLRNKKQRLQSAMAIHEVQKVMNSFSEKCSEQKKQASLHSKKTTEKKNQVGSVISKIAEEVPECERKTLLAYASNIVETAEAGRFDSQLLDLRLRIQKVNNQSKKSMAEAREAEELLDKLHGFNDNDVEDLRKELLRVSTRKTILRPALSREVTARVAVLKERQNQQYAARVLAEELEKLGYLVGPDFEVAMVDGGELALTNARLGDYRVEIQTAGLGQSFCTELSRPESQANAASKGLEKRDEEMQKVWCHDFGKSLEMAAKRGIQGKVTSFTEAGVKPVRITQSVKGDNKVASKKKKQLKSRKLRTDSNRE